MKRNILLSVRPDERASATVDTAAWLARELGADLTLMYVAVELDEVAKVAGGAGLSEESAREEMRAEARRGLERLAGERLGGLRATIRVEEGDVVERIAAVASETGASLLVIGTHGRRGASRLVLGDTSDAVLRAAPCPVVVVPRGRGAGED